MISFPTYLHAFIVSVFVPIVFAVVSDRVGMDRVTRLVCLRVLWCLPLAIGCLAVMCGALVAITP